MKPIFAGALPVFCRPDPRATGRAIPAFARKYDMSCNTCHAPSPRLKAVRQTNSPGTASSWRGKSPRGSTKTRATSGCSSCANSRWRSAWRVTPRWHPRPPGRPTSRLPGSSNFSGGVMARECFLLLLFLPRRKGEVAGVEDAFLMFNNFFEIDLDLSSGSSRSPTPCSSGSSA